jgi:hypothetical protein
MGPGGTTAPASVWVAYFDTNGLLAASGAPITGLGQVGTFSTPEEASDSAGGGAARPAVGPSGQLLVSYETDGGDAGPATIRSVLDPDGLGPKGMNPTIDDTAVNIGGIYPTTPQPVHGIDAGLTIAYDLSNGPHRGRVYLLKSDTEPFGNPETDLFAQFSDDNGTTWSSDALVDDSGGTSVLFNTRVAVDPTTGVVAMSWLDTRNDPGSGPGDTDGKLNTDVEMFGTISTDGGNTFLKNVQISSGPSNAIAAGNGTDNNGFDFGDYTGLAYYDNVFLTAWPDNSKTLAGNPNRPNLNIATAAVTVSGPTPTLGLAGKGTPITANAAQPFSGTVATFTGNSASVPLSSYVAGINWGDGTTSAGTVSLASGGGLSVSGNHTYVAGGTYVVGVVLVQQGSVIPSVVTTTATVAASALLGTPVSFFAQEGQKISVVVARFSDTNPIAQPASSYQASIDWGDGTTTTGFVTPDRSGGFDVNGTHALGGGTDSIRITIKSTQGALLTVTSTATVTDSPLTAGSVAITATEGVSFSGAVATFSDADPRVLSASYYSAQIDWSDGTTSTGTIVPTGASQYTVTGQHLFRVGTHTVTVTIKDSDVSQAMATSTATVADAPLSGAGLTIHGIEGATFSGVIATMNDVDPSSRRDTFTLQVDWGDGTSSAGRLSYEGDGLFLLVGDHAYRTGTYTFTVTMSEVGQPSISLKIPGTAIIADAPLAAGSAPPIQGVEGVGLNATIATFADPDTLTAASNFTAMIQWGDGLSSPGTVSATGGGTFAVNGSHAYTAQGNYSTTVQIADNGGASTTVGTAVTIGDAPLSGQGAPISATAKTAFSGTVATFTDANPNGTAGENSASIDWGDGTISDGVVVASGPNSFAVQGGHTYNQGGNFTVTVNITSTGGSKAVAFGSADVQFGISPLDGRLNPASDSGASNNDGITNIVQPTFVGAAAPNAVITLYAEPVGTTQPVVVGRGHSDGFGNWSISTIPLSNGAYTIFAAATSPSGSPESNVVQLLPTANRGPLVIDTAGPVLSAATLDPRTGEVQIVIQDALGGVDPLPLANPMSYTLSRANRALTVTGLQLSNQGPSNFIVATITFNGGRPLARGVYTLTAGTAGMTDLAGNALVVTAGSAIPTGPGTNLLSQFRIVATRRKPHPKPPVPPRVHRIHFKHTKVTVGRAHTHHG